MKPNTHLTFAWGIIAFQLAILVGIMTAITAPAVAESNYGFQKAQNTLQSYCLFCHGPNEPAGGVNLVDLLETKTVAEQIEMWSKVEERVHNREMPPQNALPLPDEEREALVNWIKSKLKEAACGEGIQPGPATIRRLNRNEYAATIRDLLGIHFNAAHRLPADGAGGEGFDNAAETLFISPVHLERYLETADEILDYAAKDNQARERIFITRPDDETSHLQAASRVLERFATRAFRRPTTEEERARLLQLYQKARHEDASFEQAVFYALRAVLISPHFLFLIEQPNLDQHARPIGDYELASRLSYFLWSSMPDEELFELARLGELQDERVLREQMRRMLNQRSIRRNSSALEDRKAHEFALNFVSQWLGTRELGRGVQPDAEKFPRYDQQLEMAMKYEPVYVFQHIMTENLSLLHLIDSHFTYMNRQLSRHYGVEDDVDANQMQLIYVEFPQKARRGGVMTMAGPLTVTSFPHRTSPVLRGKWVLESLLGTPPPPPPPNVPELPEDDHFEQPTTIRERLEQHRDNPACASCHARIDPIGFGLENFNPIGQWREQDAGQPIDASGQLPNGQRFEGPSQLKQVLYQQKDVFIRNLVEKMLGYELGRGLVLEDQCTVDQIMQELKLHDYKAQVLIEEIITSVPFRYRAPEQAHPGAATTMISLPD